MCISVNFPICLKATTINHSFLKSHVYSCFSFCLSLHLSLSLAACLMAALCTVIKFTQSLSRCRALGSEEGCPQACLLWEPQHACWNEHAAETMVKCLGRPVSLKGCVETCVERVFLSLVLLMLRKLLKRRVDFLDSAYEVVACSIFLFFFTLLFHYNCHNAVCSFATMPEMSLSPSKRAY